MTELAHTEEPAPPQDLAAISGVFGRVFNEEPPPFSGVRLLVDWAMRYTFPHSHVSDRLSDALANPELLCPADRLLLARFLTDNAAFYDGYDGLVAAAVLLQELAAAARFIAWGIKQSKPHARSVLGLLHSRERDDLRYWVAQATLDIRDRGQLGDRFAPIIVAADVVLAHCA